MLFSPDVSFISIHLGVCMFVSFFVLLAHFQLCPTDKGYWDSVIMSLGASHCFSAVRYVEFEQCLCSVAPRNYCSASVSQPGTCGWTG